MHIAIPMEQRVNEYNPRLIDHRLRAVLSVPQNGFDFLTCNDNPL